MLELDQARERLLQSVSPLRTIALPLAQAVGHALSGPIRADRPIPPYDRAAMDGYAVRSADLGSEGGRLMCVGEIKAGDEWSDAVQPATCVAVMTGAALPAGADAVIEVEKTRQGALRATEKRNPAGEIVFTTGARPGHNIARQGEDAVAGALLLEPGTTLSPAGCGLLALCGYVTVQVYAEPRVALLSTGDDLLHAW